VSVLKDLSPVATENASKLKYELNVTMTLIVELPKSAIKGTAWMLADKKDAEITQNASIQFMTPDVSAFQASLVIHSANAFLHPCQHHQRLSLAAKQTMIVRCTQPVATLDVSTHVQMKTRVDGTQAVE
jgi:hypothetical protein